MQADRSSPSPASPASQASAPAPHGSAATPAALRAVLRERFPHAHAHAPQPAALPACEPEPFPAGALYELVAAPGACGCGLLLADLLGRLDAADAPEPLALIDGSDSFDPASYGSAGCARVLWVRTGAVDKSLKVADLLLRDGNLPWLVLDLAGLPEAELRRIPGSSWHRLHELARRSGARLLVMSHFPLVAKPARRVFLAAPLGLDDLDAHPQAAAGRGWHAALAASQPAEGAAQQHG